MNVLYLVMTTIHTFSIYQHCIINLCWCMIIMHHGVISITMYIFWACFIPQPTLFPLLVSNKSTFSFLYKTLYLFNVIYIFLIIKYICLFLRLVRIWEGFTINDNIFENCYLLASFGNTAICYKNVFRCLGWSSLLV